MDVIYINSPTQKIGIDKKHLKVYLPLNLKNAIQENFKGYTIPSSSNYKGDWVNFYQNNPVPFIAFGDFNYDQAQDIAVLLVGKEKSNYWKLVIFQQNSDGGYIPTVLTSSPEDNKTSSQHGRDYGPIQSYAISVVNKCRNNRLCLRLKVYEAASFEYAFSNGKY